MNIDIDALTDAVINIGLENQDEVDTGIARYFDDNNNPKCIIGHALVRIGADITPLLNGSQNNANSIDFIVEEINSVDQTKKLNFLTSVQSYQDRGISWGSSVEMSKEILSLPES